jgi:hypothetical protein
MARTTQVPIALKIKASCVFSLFLGRYPIKLGARLHLSWGQRRLAALKAQLLARHARSFPKNKAVFSITLVCWTEIV